MAADKFEGLGIMVDTCVSYPHSSPKIRLIFVQRVGSTMNRYANSDHDYSFPRISVTLGDGATPYDYGDDGEPNNLDGCSVGFCLL